MTQTYLQGLEEHWGQMYEETLRMLLVGSPKNQPIPFP